jgi:hypothetical protein
MGGDVGQLIAVFVSHVSCSVLTACGALGLRAGNEVLNILGPPSLRLMFSIELSQLKGRST